MFCRQCGREIVDDAIVCVHCGAATGQVAIATGAKSRVGYVLFGIFLGCLGIHNFYAGYTGRGIAQLLITLVAWWLVIPLFMVWIWAIVEVCAVTKDAKGRPLI